MTPSLYVHPDSPLSGGQVSKQMCSFEKLKLTNNDLDQNNHVSSNPSRAATLENLSFAVSFMSFAVSNVFQKKNSKISRKKSKNYVKFFPYTLTANDINVVLFLNPNGFETTGHCATGQRSPQFKN